MKKYMLIILAAYLAGCNSNDTPDYDATGTVDMTFAINGDFTLSVHDFTRALTADGKDMTDVWVLDYMDGTLMQTVHQVSTDDDFGQPVMTLALGEHHLYFVPRVELRLRSTRQRVR